MRISIDASGLGGPKTGTTVYLTEILATWNQDLSIDHEFLIFTNANAMPHLTALGLDRRFHFVLAPGHRHFRVLWQQVVMPRHIARYKADAHWGTGFVLPLASEKPMVVTVHDLTFQLFPEVHERIKRYYFPAMVKAAVNKAREIIVVSESTRADLCRLLPASRSKTQVTLLAARRFGYSEEVNNHKKPDLGGSDYVLFVGTIEPRKNLPRLIAAWQSLEPAIRGGTKLVIAGATGWLVGELMSTLKSTDSIEFRGQVSDIELADLMKRAIAFLYPTLYEGFGLPVVEAMSLGIPVLTSNVGATREVAEGAAILVDPTSIADIRAGLTHLLKEPDLRESLASLGRQRAASFSWERTARETLAIIERAG